MSIATGNATGVYFSLGNAYAEQISAATDGKVKATAAETGASVQNIQQLVGGSYQVAFSLADTAADAVEGKGSFDGEKQPVQALSRIYPNYTQVIARTGSGITSSPTCGASGSPPARRGRAPRSSPTGCSSRRA